MLPSMPGLNAETREAESSVGTNGDGAARRVGGSWRGALVCLLLTTGGPATAMDLLGAYRAALENDAVYQSIRAASSATREALPQARAQLLPQLSASGSRFNNDTRSERTLTNIFGQKQKAVEHNPDYDSSTLSLTLRQSIFRMDNVARYLQARSQVEGAAAEEDKGRQDLAVRLASTYFEALAAQDSLAQIRARKESLQAQLSASRRLFTAGQGTRTEIEEAQARFDEIAAQEIMAREQTAFTLEQLRVLVNQPVPAIAILTPEHLQLLPPDPRSLEDWVQQAEANSPELRRLAAAVEVAEKEVLKAQSGHFPTLDLVAQRNRQENDNVTAQNTIYHNTTVGLQLNIPLFSSGYTSSTVTQARQMAAKARHDHEAARRNLRVQVRKQYQGVADGIEEIRALEQALRSADQALTGTRKGVQAGTRTTLDVLNVEDKRATVLRDLGHSRYRYLVARVSLLGVTGGDTLAEIERINRWLGEVRPVTE